MIPVPVVAPLVAPPREPRGGVVTRVVGVTLLVLAATGAWAWFTVLSPAGFHRWEVYETSSTLQLEPGTYTVFEEFPGASTGTTRTPLNVVVRSIAGRDIAVTSFLGANDDADPPSTDPPPAPPDGYRTPWHEGRATAEFRIDRTGTYSVTVFSSVPATTNRDYNDLLTSHVAVAPAGQPVALGSGWGLLVVTFIPLALGLLALTVARLRWPRPTRRARRYPAPSD